VSGVFVLGTHHWFVMTEFVYCPRCQNELEVPIEFRGRSVRCGGCGLVFEVPNSASPGVSRSREQELLEPQAERSRALPRPERPELDDDGRDRSPTRKKSNAGVWLFLLLTAIALGVVVAYACKYIVKSFEPITHAINRPEGGFRVNMPGDAPIDHPAFDEGDGKKITSVVSSRDFGNEQYEVKYFDLPGKPKKVDQQTILADAIKKELNLKVLANSVATLHQGKPALDVLIDNGVFAIENVIVRAILADQRVYLLVVRGAMRPEYPHIKRFFLSFTITDRK